MAVTLERTPVEKQIYVKSLLDSGATWAAVHRAVPGIGDHTIQAIQECNTYSGTLLDQFKKRLPFKAYKLADDVLDLIKPDEIAKAPLGVKMMAFGVAIDKARDMEGSNRPVFNIVSIINECKQTCDKLKDEMLRLESIECTGQ